MPDDAAEDIVPLSRAVILRNQIIICRRALFILKQFDPTGFEILRLAWQVLNPNSGFNAIESEICSRRYLLPERQASIDTKSPRSMSSSFPTSSQLLAEGYVDIRTPPKFENQDQQSAGDIEVGYEDSDGGYEGDYEEYEDHEVAPSEPQQPLSAPQYQWDFRAVGYVSNEALFDAHVSQ